MRRCAPRPQGALCHGVITTFLAQPSPLSRDTTGVCKTDGASRKKKGLNLPLGPGLSQIWFLSENTAVPSQALKGQRSCFGHHCLWLQVRTKSNRCEVEDSQNITTAKMVQKCPAGIWALFKDAVLTRKWHHTFSPHDIFFFYMSEVVMKNKHSELLEKYNCWFLFHFN